MFEVVAYMIRRYGVDVGTAEKVSELFEDLLDAGFSAPDVEKALSWMRGLRTSRGSSRGVMSPPSKALRVATCEETLKFTPEARGLLLRLERGGILDEALRELVYEKALTLDVPELGVDEVCVLLAVLLEAAGFGNGPLATRLLLGELERIHH